MLDHHLGLIEVKQAVGPAPGRECYTDMQQSDERLNLMTHLLHMQTYTASSMTSAGRKAA